MLGCRVMLAKDQILEAMHVLWPVLPSEALMRSVYAAVCCRTSDAAGGAKSFVMCLPPGDAKFLGLTRVLYHAAQHRPRACGGFLAIK